MCGEVQTSAEEAVDARPGPAGGRCARWGLRTAVLREQRVGGVKFIGNSELWCWEVVKLLSYNTRRGRAEGGGGRSLVVYCFCLFTSLPCLGLFTTKRPLNTRIFTVRKTLFTRISLQDKRSSTRKIFVSGCSHPFLERAEEALNEHLAVSCAKISLDISFWLKCKYDC